MTTKYTNASWYSIEYTAARYTVGFVTLIAQRIIFGSVWLSSPSTQHHGTSRTSASGAPLPPWCRRYSASACCQRDSPCCPHIAAWQRGQPAQGGERQWGAHHDDQHIQQQRHQERSVLWVLYVRLWLWPILLRYGIFSTDSSSRHPEASIHPEATDSSSRHPEASIHPEHIQHQQLRQRQERPASSLKSEAIFEPFKCSQCSSDQSLA